MATPDEQIARLEAAMAALEAQRAALGDAVADAALAPLRQQLAELRRSPGTAAGPASPSFEGERRVVTILFADIAGFTAMSEKMDPEQVRGLMNACFDDLVPAIHKYEGTVNKFIGDEIMALFGAPVAHENDAERALRAALEMVGRLREFNARHQTDLGLHFGINTGMVIAGSIGAQQQQQYDVLGDAVNVAARLEGESERGEIFVGPDTYRMTSPLFEFEPLPPVRVKGKSEPVPIYKLLREKARPGRVRGLPGLESEMVGRAEELSALLAAGASVSAGRGGAVALIGEAGLGKSRLVAEWKSAVEKSPPSGARPLSFVEGRCLPHGRGLVYHLVIDLLKSLLNAPPPAGAAELDAALRALMRSLNVEGYAFLAHLLSLPLSDEAQQQLAALDPQALQARTLLALSALISARAGHGPLVCVLDDLHWADPASIELLIELLPLTRRAPVLFCALSRPDRDQPGWRWVAAARESLDERYVEIMLGPLSEGDSRQLVANLLEVESLPEHVRQSILQRAEGNPFFVEEVIRMLIERGSLARRGERWVALKAAENVDIPDTLHGLLMARLDRLPEEARHALRVAAVIGRQFSAKILEQVIRQ
jgi:class 3 adenylate cyclase